MDLLEIAEPPLCIMGTCLAPPLILCNLRARARSWESRLNSKVKWGSISLHGELELGSTTTAMVGTPAARSLSSGRRPDGGSGRS